MSDKLTIYFAQKPEERVAEEVDASVHGVDLVLTAPNGITLVVDTRDLMRVILGDPD